MRVVIQRVSQCAVTIDSVETRQTGQGLLILVGVVDGDGSDDIDWLVRKILNTRIFDDDNGVMNKSVVDLSGDLMIVSQFTLHASTKKGNRPSYIKAAKPDIAIPLYEAFVSRCQESDLLVKTGTFGADMKVELINDGPVTIIIDSKLKE